jgi:hypothetical protein
VSLPLIQTQTTTASITGRKRKLKRIKRTRRIRKAKARKSREEVVLAVILNLRKRKAKDTDLAVSLVRKKTCPEKQ